MAEERWYSRALPLLEAIDDLEQEGVDSVTVNGLTDKTKLTPRTVHGELRRLVGRYIGGQYEEGWSDDPGENLLMGLHLTEDGSRAVGAYPPRDPYEALVAILERHVAEAPDEPTRSKWRKVLDTVTGLGRDVGSNVLANVLVDLGVAASEATYSLLLVGLQVGHDDEGGTQRRLRVTEQLQRPCRHLHAVALELVKDHAGQLRHEHSEASMGDGLADLGPHLLHPRHQLDE